MVFKESFKLESRHRAVSFHDVTHQVKDIAVRSGIKNGIVVVYSHHTTCSVITQECAFDTSMTGLETLQAVLPVGAAVILVLISMGLTLIAGLFPSRVAAKKDPVIALRSE